MDLIVVVSAERQAPHADVAHLPPVAPHAYVVDMVELRLLATDGAALVQQARIDVTRDVLHELVERLVLHRHVVDEAKIYEPRDIFPCLFYRAIRQAERIGKHDGRAACHEHHLSELLRRFLRHVAPPPGDFPDERVGLLLLLPADFARITELYINAAV